MTIEFKTVEYRIHNATAIISLNRPEVMNSFDQQMRDDLLAAIRAAEKNESVRTIVLTGNGRGFSAGTDLAEGVPGGLPTQELLDTSYNPLVMAINQCPKLIIAAVNGAAAGVGAAMVMSCDLIIMAESAYLFQAFSAIGLIPDGGTNWQLVQQLGYHRALEIIVEGGKVSADDCVQMGLANRTAKDDALLGDAIEWADSLATKAPLTLSFAKRLLKEAQTQSLVQALASESVIQGVVSASDDAKEGITAFLEKRQANFTGK